MPRSTPDAGIAKNGGRSVRLLRIGEQVRHALAEVIGRGELRDELLTRLLVSVNEVRVSPDLRHATVFVKALAGGDDAAVIAALTSHGRYLRGEVARKLATKYTPELTFRRDDSFDAGAHIDAILRRPEVARDLAASRPEREDGDDDA
ncbi:ribosome-binding factor A [alpha proteobacterium AAP81b]|nr:ribosome-binding factor A [alpha proteobacterium AAP81b]